jgi:hypothetical protein
MYLHIYENRNKYVKLNKTHFENTNTKHKNTI